MDKINGSDFYPTVTVTMKDDPSKVIDDSHYDLTFPDSSVAVGTYTYKITMKNGYTGSRDDLTYTINPPAKEISKVKKGKKSFVVKWQKADETEMAGVDGYLIKYSVKKNMKKAKTKAVKKNTAKKVKVKKLKGGKKYFVQMCAYKVVEDTLYYSDWSAKKKVKTKK